MKFDTLRELFIDELRELYTAEKQVAEILPQMARVASAPDLRQAFEEHLRVTHAQLERLKRIFHRLEIEPSERSNASIRGLVADSQEIITSSGNPTVKDAALIGAAQRVEHYEIAVYGTLREFAYQLNYPEIAELLQQTLDALDEEGPGPEELTILTDEDF